MRIIELHIDSLKKIKAVEITPSKHLVKISGKNGQGKTSILDSIELALSGGAIPKDIVNHNQKMARISASIGDDNGVKYVVKKRISDGGAYLEVETSDGAVMKKGQTFLDGLIGKIAFDPSEFLRMEAKKQRQVLLNALGVDIDSLDTEYKHLYEDRTIANREYRKAITIVEQLGNIEVANPVDVSELSRSLSEIHRQREAAKNTFNTYERKLNEKKDIEEEMKRLQERLDILNIEIEAVAQSNISEKLKKLDAEIDGINQKLTNATVINQKAKRYEESVKAQKELAEAEKQVEEIGRKMEEITNKKSKLLSDSKMPIDGLSITDDAVTFKGSMLENLSDSEKISVSLAISMALNPELRVALIRNGSLFDSETLTRIEEIAKANDFQIWVEIVSDDYDTDNNAVMIYDGEVKGV